MVDYSLLQTVPHNWYNKGCGMYYPVESLAANQKEKSMKWFQQKGSCCQFLNGKQINEFFNLKIDSQVIEYI